MKKFVAAVFKRKARKVEKGGKTVKEERDQYMPTIAHHLENCGWSVYLVETELASEFMPRLEELGIVSLVVCAPPLMEGQETLGNMLDQLAVFSKAVSKMPETWVMHVTQGQVRPQIRVLEKSVSVSSSDDYIDALKTPAAFKDLMSTTLWSLANS